MIGLFFLKAIKVTNIRIDKNKFRGGVNTFSEAKKEKNPLDFLPLYTSI